MDQRVCRTTPGILYTKSSLLSQPHHTVAVSAAQQSRAPCHMESKIWHHPQPLTLFLAQSAAGHLFKMQSRLPSTQLSLEVTSPFQHEVVTTSCSWVPCQTSWVKVNLHLLPSASIFPQPSLHISNSCFSLTPCGLGSIIRGRVFFPLLNGIGLL